MSAATPSPSKSRPISNGSLLPPSASREKIRAESATGWSPLRIQKKPGQLDSPTSSSSLPQDSLVSSSPLANKHSTTTTQPEPEETYRRSSSSYKHLKTNSLVSNSPFKSGVGSDNNTPPPPPLPPLAKRAAAAKKAGYGLGISSSPSSSPRAPPTQRMQAGGGGATPVGSHHLPRASPRRSSADRRKNEENLDPTLTGGEPAVVVVVPGGGRSDDEDEGGGVEAHAGGGGGLSSGEDEPNAAAAAALEKRRLDFKKDAKRRQSAGLAGLSSKSKVSNSPFLTRSSSSEMEDSATAAPAAPPTPSPLVQSTSDDQLVQADEDDDQSQSQYDDEEEDDQNAPQHPTLFHPSPLESLSSTLSSSQPSSPSTSSVLSAASPPPPTQAPSTPPRPTHLLLQEYPVSPSPGRSSLKSRRIKGPRDSAGSGSGGIAGSGTRPRRKTVTFQEGAEVSVFERAEGESLASDEDSDEERYGVPSDEDEEDENYGEEGSFDLDPHQHSQQRGGYSDEEEEEDSSFTNQGGYPDDPSRDGSSTADFISALAEEDLFSPSSVASPVFQSGMMGNLGIPPSPLLTSNPSPTPASTNNASVEQPHHHHHHHPTPPQSDLPHPNPNEHVIGLNEEVEVEEREGEVKVHQEGPLRDPFLPTTPKRMGGLGLGRPSGDVPRRREAEPELEPEPEVEEDEEEVEEAEMSMLDEGDSAVLEELEQMGLEDEEEEEEEEQEEEYVALEEQEQEEEEEGNHSFWEEEKTSEEVALVEEEVAEHPLMGSRGLRLDAVEVVAGPEIARQVTPPPTFLAAPLASADSPWKLPSLDASTSPLFSMKDLPETSPAVPQQPTFPAPATATALPPLITAQFQTSTSEQSLASSAGGAGEFGSYKPSSSLERLRAEEDGGSASGRFPLMTKASIRRRVDAKNERDRVERERVQKEKELASSNGGKINSTSEPWRPIEGLGIAMPSTSPTKAARPLSSRSLASTQEEHRPTSRPSSPEKIAHLNKELPAPPPTSHAMSRPKAATTDSLPASVRPRSSESERPQLGGRNRSSALSARDLLASESALGKLALGAVATAAPSPTTRGTEVVRNNGSEKEVKLNTKSLDLERASSSPIEETTISPFHLGGGSVRGSIPSTFLSGGEEKSSRKGERERVLMPPPPVPRTNSNTRSTSPTPSNASSTREREEAILAKRREKREEAGVGRPKGRGRRSLSTGDATMEGVQSAAASAAVNASKRRTFQPTGSRPQSTLNDVSIGANLTPFENDLTNEFDRITDHRNRQYKLVERPQVYIATDEQVSHSKKAGDLDRGKAWRSVKRPSDMNEYAEEIREIRAREKPGKSHAKVFVKIIGISDIDVPIPESTTTFQIVLNNGLHSVETQAYKFGKQVEIGQEFELLGLDNLEFSLAIKVRKDQHINSRLRSLTPRPGPAPSIIAPSIAPSTPTKTSAFRKLISSPRKPKPTPSPVVVAARPVAPEPIKDDLVRYLGSDGQLAIVKVIFKEIAEKCRGQILNLHLPLTGRWNNDAVNSDAAARSPDAAKKSRQIGRMQLQVLMIDQIPGVPSDKLPQSLDDAVTGLRHVRWHKMDYFSGSLTQLGGDCSSWRRRHMRIVGGTLEATSDVTGKITARIDLSKMVEIRDDNVESSNKDHDRTMSVERSFRLVFDDGEEIQFFADKDKDKEDWLHHLRELLGRVPSLPLWAELLWVRQHQEQSPVL